MPMMMNFYDPMEIVVTLDVTYILISHVNDSYRRIYTDGRGWPAEDEFVPTFAGYSIGKWIDEDGDGKYDVLEVETRNFKGPRNYEPSGIPLHENNETIIKERMYIAKDNPDTLVNEITTFDHALTRPWTVNKKYVRGHNLIRENICAEGNGLVRVGNEIYMRSADNELMPAKKGQQPPSLRYFNRAPK